MRSRILILIFSLIFIVAAHSQEIVKSTVIEKIDGKEYYIHTVQKKESVWKIAKAYNVTTDDIIAANPGVDKKINPGQKLKIPIKKTETKQTSKTTDYKVEKGENLSTIAKKNNVTVDDIYKANPGLTDKLKPGQIIKIPHKINIGDINNIDSLKRSVDSTIYDCNKPRLLDSYNIALMIPFSLDEMGQVNPEDPNIKEKDASDYSSLTFIQYYEGLLMAADSMKKLGFTAKIYVYDVDEDSAATQKILEKPELSKMNLIIGPFYEGSLRTVIRFAKKHNIKVVDPVSTNDSILKCNPVVYNAAPSIEMQLKQLAVFITGRYPTSPVVVVHNNKETEKAYATVFESALNAERKKAGLKDSVCHVVIYNQAGFSGITKRFNAADTNIVVTLSSGEMFVTKYITNFNNIYGKYKMIVFGLPSWKNYDNIEVEYMQNINLHIFSSTFVDYSDENVKKFILEYRDSYKTEPDKYAFQGFDVGMFFFTALKKFGVNFDKCIDNVGGDYLQSDYKFVKTGEKDGYDNSFLNIYRYEDYRTVDVRKYPKIKEKEKKKEKGH